MYSKKWIMTNTNLPTFLDFPVTKWFRLIKTPYLEDFNFQSYQNLIIIFSVALLEGPEKSGLCKLIS